MKKNLVVSKVLTVLVLTSFIFQDASFALSPGVISGGLSPMSEKDKNDMHAGALRKLLDKRGPGSIDWPTVSGRTNTELQDYMTYYEKAKAPRSAWLTIVPTDYKNPPKEWENNPILAKTNLLKAMRDYCAEEANMPAGWLTITAEEFEVQPGLLKVSKLSKKEDGTYVLKVSPSFIAAWDEIRANDVWYRVTIAKGAYGKEEARTVSLAWSIFYRLMKHEVTDISKLDGFPKGAIGHLTNIPGIGFSATDDEISTNRIGGNYARYSDAGWMWFLGSHQFTQTVQKDDKAFAARLYWLFNDKDARNIGMRLEFFGLETKQAQEEVIGIARAVNRAYYDKYKSIAATADLESLGSKPGAEKKTGDRTEEAPDRQAKAEGASVSEWKTMPDVYVEDHFSRAVSRLVHDQTGAVRGLLSTDDFSGTTLRYNRVGIAPNGEFKVDEAGEVAITCKDLGAKKDCSLDHFEVVYDERSVLRGILVLNSRYTAQLYWLPATLDRAGNLVVDKEHACMVFDSRFEERGGPKSTHVIRSSDGALQSLLIEDVHSGNILSIQMSFNKKGDLVFDDKSVMTFKHGGWLTGRSNEFVYISPINDPTGALCGIMSAEFTSGLVKFTPAKIGKDGSMVMGMKRSMEIGTTDVVLGKFYQPAEIYPDYDRRGVFQGVLVMSLGSQSIEYVSAAIGADNSVTLNSEVTTVCKLSTFGHGYEWVISNVIYDPNGSISGVIIRDMHNQAHYLPVVRGDAGKFTLDDKDVVTFRDTKPSYGAFFWSFIKPVFDDKGTLKGIVVRSNDESSARLIKPDREIQTPVVAAKGLEETIAEYIVELGQGRGPGQEAAVVQESPKLNSSEYESLYGVVKMVHDSRIEVLLPKTMMLTDAMKKTLKSMQARDSVIARTYDSEDHLGTLLSNPAEDGVRRIVVADEGMGGGISSLANTKPELFAKTRLFMLALPKQYQEIDAREKTVYQADIMTIAILARLLEGEGKTPMVEALLRTMVENRLYENMEQVSRVDDFITNMIESPEEAANPQKAEARIKACLGLIVRLVEKMGKELILMQAFWTAA